MYHNKRKKIGKDLLVWSFVLVVLAAMAIADVGPVAVEVEADETIATEIVVAAAGAVGLSRWERSGSDPESSAAATASGRDRPAGRRPACCCDRRA